MPSNEYYDSSGYPSTGGAGSSASMRAEFDAIEAMAMKLPALAGNGDEFVTVNTGGTALESIDAAAALTRLGAIPTASKDATGGVVGLTLFKINFKNALNTITSFFTNGNTVARTYTFPDKDGTVAMTADIPTVTGTNTGDQTAATVPNTPAGTISATDVQTALNELDTEKAPLASPALTGNPTAPTQAATDNSTRLATTAHVFSAFVGDGGATGYQKFRSGVVVQWGSATGHATPGTAKAVSFPLAFTATRGVYATGVTNAITTTNAAVWTSEPTTTGFNIHTALANETVYWFAIGTIA